jgi:serine/threonine-protein kinase
MPDTSHPATLDTAHLDVRREQFENAWRSWRPGQEPPRWQQFLPAPDEACSPDLILQLLRLDIEFRARTGLPALLTERYFEHPRLQQEDARLDAGQHLELIRWEYRQRWKNGQRARRADYEVAFPEHAAALRDLRPRYRCPQCGKEFVLEETASTRACPECEGSSFLTGDSPPFVAETTRAAATPTKIDLRDYQLIEQLGAGGMGEVYRSCDPALERDLAIKVMKASLKGNPEGEQRFLREARVTGSLQHPGIVPVHNLGRLADGRLHYTMRLVRGRTFADILKQEAGKPERLPSLLGIFEKICQAVAYAHSKHVIHRDLKPANVMVGRFGEVQVMDWGLAKLLSPDGGTAAPEETIDAAITRIPTESAGTPVDLSRTGSGMGTPAYMPPEQALGEWDAVDERADVFALGSILCELLTGQPAYSGGDGDERLRRARRGDVAEAWQQLEQCGADAALTALCRACLSPDPEGRLRNAGAVAKRVGEYQAEVQERLRRAELERVAAETRAREEQVRAAVERERTREALGRVVAERRAKRRTLALAAALMLLVVGVAGGTWWQQWKQARADQAVNDALAQVELLEQQAQAEPLQTDRYRQALDAARAAAKVAEGASEEPRRRAEELLVRLERETQAAVKDRELLIELLDVYAPHEGPKYKSNANGMMVALVEPTADELFAASFRRWGLELEDESIREAAVLLRARPPVVVTEVIAALDEWTSELRRKSRPKSEWQRITNLAEALDDDLASKRRELREMLARDQLPLERALGLLSAELRPVPIAFEAPLGRDRLRLRKLAEQIDPNAEPILGLLRLVRALRLAGEEARAEHLLRVAIVTRPREVLLHHALGQLLVAQEPPRWAEAVECYGAARVVRPDLGVNLATALLRSGRDSEGLDLLARLVRESSKNPYLRIQLANALYDKRRLDEAMDAYQQAITLDPKAAHPHNGLGNALADKGRLDEAIAEYRQAIALDSKKADIHSNLGLALHENGLFDEAIVEFRQAITLDSKHVYAHNGLGNTLEAKRRLDEAMVEYRQAIALDPKAAHPHNGLGIVLYHKGLLDEAMVEYRQAIALDPKLPHPHYNLGNALLRKGQLDEAMAEYRQVIALAPKAAKAHNVLGLALSHKGRLDEAIAEYRQAIALDPKDAHAYNNLGLALSDKGRLDEAMAEYRQAIALDPKDAHAHSNLGNALKAKRQLDAAIAEHRQAVALDPQYAMAHNNLGTALHDKGLLEEAVVEFRKAIALDPKLALPHNAMGQTLLQQGQYAAARESTQRALELFAKDAPRRQFALQQLQQCDRMLALDKKLPAMVMGAATPANPAEAILLAQMCQQHKNRHVAAARLYSDAFAIDSKLAANINLQHRYNAACSAARAAAGQSEDAHDLPDKVVVMFRGWALRWLRDDLTVYGKLVGQNDAAWKQEIQNRLAWWRRDPDLASIRDPQALGRLPDNERVAWQSLWRDAEELAKRVTESGAAREVAK